MKMTLEVDTDDVADLTAAQEMLAVHLRRHGFAPVEDEDVAAAIEAMWPDLGAESRRLLWSAAHTYEAEQEFALETLASPMGVNFDSVRAYHRNLARSLKAREIDTHRVLPSRKVGASRFYHLPEPIHERVRRLPLT